MKQLIKYSFDISLKNWSTLLLFDMLYKAISYSMLYAITSDLLLLILKIINVPYLGAENFYLVFTNPTAIILSICMVLLISFFVFFEIVAFYIYCECGWKQEKLHIIQLLKLTLRQCKKLFHMQSILLFLGFILTTILTVLPFSPYFLNWLHIAEFIMDFINENQLLFYIYSIIVIPANFIFVLFLFALYFTIFHHKSIKVAWKEGLLLLKKRKITTIFRILGAFIVFGFVIISIFSIMILGLVMYTKVLLPQEETVRSFTLYFNRVLPGVILVVKSFSTIWLFSVIITLVHQYKKDVRPIYNTKIKTSKYHILKGTAKLICAVIVIAMFSESELGGSFIYKDANTKIVAHRGGAAFAPENTIASLNAAIDMNVDTVEIDVQQLKDGSLILLHDSNFKRTAEQDKEVWEVGYSEVKNYDAGSWFSPKFQGEPIPKLDDILQKAKFKL